MVKNISSTGVNYNSIQLRRLNPSYNLYNQPVQEDKVQFSSPAFKGAAVNKVVNEGTKAVTKKLPAALAAILTFIGIKGLSKSKETVEKDVPQEKVLTPEEIAEKQAAALKAKQESAAHQDVRSVSEDFNMESDYIKKYYPVKSMSDEELIISAQGTPFFCFESAEIKYGLYGDAITSIELVTLVNKNGSCIKIINGEDGQATAKYIDRKGVEYNIPLLNFEKLVKMNKELSACRNSKKIERIIQRYQKDVEEYKYTFGLGGNNTTEAWMISTGADQACLRNNSIKQSSSSSSSSSTYYSSDNPEVGNIELYRGLAAKYRRLAEENRGGIAYDGDGDPVDAYRHYSAMADLNERNAAFHEHAARVYEKNEAAYFKNY